MDPLFSDMSHECLVTDIVNELSSELEIPFLLRNDISCGEKLESNLYDDFFKTENFSNESLVTDIDDDNDGKVNFDSNDIDDLSSYWKNRDFNLYLTNQTLGTSSGSQSGSGSECSSAEIWVFKNDLDTPPVTPPDESTTPESDEIKFVPIFSDNAVNNLTKVNISNPIRVQPKPIPNSLCIVASEKPNLPTVCNVFNDKNPITSRINGETKVYYKADLEKKKAVLSKKDLELQAKIKQERMIRNRESAYLSRKRKKEHLAQLEKQVKELIKQNDNLKLENFKLRQKLAYYENGGIYGNTSAQPTRIIFTKSSRKATALCALLLIFCLNFGSFSTFINDFQWGKSDMSQGNVAELFSTETRHTRSLLWSGTEFKDSKSSSYTNSTTTSCPAFINQSESIRLESELRRWIGNEDDYAGLSNNISKLNQYFYSTEKPVLETKTTKSAIKRKKIPGFKRKSSMIMDMYKMRSNLFDFETFFGAINRRDDTFYLLSFSGDHLLLPALSHNQTSRPKMSLMLPAFFSNVTKDTFDQVEMMQIDCEVTNTQILSVNENSIPSYMRPFSNFTEKAKFSEGGTHKPEKFEDYFLSRQESLLHEQNQFKPKESSEIYKNQISPARKIRKPVLKFALAKLMKLQPTFEFNSTLIDKAKQKKAYIKKHVDPKKIDLFNNKTNEENFRYIESRKSPLKKLMVSPYIFNSKTAMTNNNSTEGNGE